jgi:peptide/nickel transport system substrate-binding protein
VDAKAEKLDDQNVRLTFSKPNPLFIELMNRGTGGRATSWQMVPAHYLKQFHYKYTPAATDVKVLQDHYDRRLNYPDMPHNGPWIVKEIKDGEFVRLTRNPYYWKVDTEGNQLPYMDEMEMKAVKTADLISLSAISGELDFQLREMALKDLPLLKENATKGAYRVDMWKNGDCGSAGILFHYCNPDKALAALMFKREFRMAMSYAINKVRINDIVFLGLGRPRQIAMLADGPEFASPRGKKVLKDWEDSCIEYDVNKAKALLDGLGLKDVNNDGFREYPDGKPLDIICDVDVNAKAEVEAQQLIKEDFAKVGLKWTLNVIDGTILSTRANECSSAFRSRGGSASGLFIAPAHWTPVEDTEYTIAGPAYGRWYQSGGKLGTEPPPEAPWMKKLQQIYGEAILIVDTAKRHDKTLDGYQVHIDEGPFQIGTVGDTLMGVVCKNNMKNVIKTGIIGSWVFGFPGTADPEQWFKE